MAGPHCIAPDGSLLGSINQALPADAFFGFRATAGEQIRGISLTNTDLFGIAYDNVTFNQQAGNPVPEPASMSLLGIGLLGLMARRRARRS